MKTIRRILLLATLLLSAHADLRAQEASAPSPLMLRLRDGNIQWGTIQSHDPDGIVFERLDTRGRVRLPWTFLHPEEERELRTRFGYVDLSGDEILVDADHIVTVEGAEITGIIVDRSGDTLLVKTSSATIPVPKNRLAGVPAVVQVPASEVYTRAELYAQGLANADTSTADGQFELARWCERIHDYAHAVEHYKQAASLDATFKIDDVRASLERATQKAAHQDQVDYLADVDALTARRKFDEAIARAEAFKERYPDSPLASDAKRSRDRAVKARDKFVADRVATLWFVRTGALARTMAGKLGYEAAVEYAGSQMQKDVLAYVVKEAALITKEANEDVIRNFWKQRRKIRWSRATYGLGTWLLGRDAALKGNEPEKKAETPVSAKDKERAELDAKLRQYLQNQEMARKAKSTAEQKDDREAAWKELSLDNKAGWILAYYVENSGDFEIDPKPTFTPCRECGGEGTRILSLAGANVSRSAVGKNGTDTKIECPSCHGLGVVRRISYR